VTYKAMVVGLGQIGMGYDLYADPQDRIATLARAFSEHKAYDLVCAVDPNSASRDLFQAHYAVPAFENIEAAIENTNPDVVAIAVPTSMHYPVFSQLMKLGIFKSILCEKPLSHDLIEATAMVRLASDSRSLLFTNYMRRCDSAVREVRRRIVSKEIIGPIKGICWYSKGLFNNGSHFLNLFQYWLGNVLSFKIIDSGRLWEGCDPEPDVQIKFESGEIYFHAAREENFSHCSVELIATNGRLRYERGSMIWQSTVQDDNNVGYIVLNSNAEVVRSDAARLQWVVMDQMARHLAGENTSICTGSQGLSTIQVLTQIREKI
jgi:predicted dehydrogenase